jgi:hypothetical protein
MKVSSIKFFTAIHGFADSSIARLDSAHRQALLSLAINDEHLKGANAAKNVLNFFYDSAYFTPAYLPEVQYGKKGEEEVIKYEMLPKKIGSIKLYPNPAQNTVTIAYEGIEERSTLYISDIFGVLKEVKLF